MIYPNMTDVPFPSLLGLFRGLYSIFLQSFSVHPKFIQPPVVATTVAKPNFMFFKPQAICQTQAGQIPGRSMQEGKTPILAKTTALKTQQHAEDQIVEGCVSRLVGMPPQKQSVQSLFVVG